MMEGNAYGSVWQQATSDIAAQLDSGLPADDVFRRVLGLGYFSQFTSYPSAEFNEAVVAWLESHLLARHRFALADLPGDLEELDIAPAATIVRRAGRKLSPDLLRYVAYARQLEEAWQGGNREPAEILEIGGGYGGLARTLKSFHPKSRLWLTDLPESLRCAEIYLRKAFPDARVLWLDSGSSGPVPEVDFHLVPVQEAARFLSGRAFDLAINVWSFGEMPNDYVKSWLKLLQHDCRVEWLFTINSFMAPVTPASAVRTRIGDWLFGLDDRWAIEQFEIDPAVHHCPLIRNFPKGIGLVARRVADDAAIARLRAEASSELEAVHREDWARIAANERSHADPARPERMIDRTQPDWHRLSCRRLFALTDYIGHFNIEAGKDGPFFRLWNDYRVNRNEDAGALLAAYLGMAGKTDLERKCTKEELFLLRRLADRPLHQEYAAFAAALERGKVSHDGAWLTDQEACDRALNHKKAGEFGAAEILWTKVAAAYPAHGDCWFQLALLREIRGALPEAALYAAHSVHLGCPYYAAEAERIRAACSTVIAARERKANDARPLLSRWLARRGPAQPPEADASQLEAGAVECFWKYFEGEPGRALTALALARRASGEETGAQALERAAASYPQGRVSS